MSDRKDAFDRSVWTLMREGKRESEICRILGKSRNGVRRAMQDYYLRDKEEIEEIINEVVEKQRKAGELYKCPICRKEVLFPCVKCMTQVLSRTEVDVDVLELEDASGDVELEGDERERYLECKNYRDEHDGKPKYNHNNPKEGWHEI